MIFRWLSGLALAASLLAAPAYAPAWAQVDKEMIVVTGSMIRDADEESQAADGFVGPRRELPYVSIAVPADFVIFTVTLETGTRSVDERERELERTFTTLAGRVTRAQGVIMEVGQPGNSAPLETAAAKEAIENYGDRSRIPVVFKFAVQRNDTFSTVRARAEKFIADTQVTGRAEVVTGDLQYIGVTEPKKHREDLLRKIAEDTRLLQSIFSPPGTVNSPPAMSLTGLEGRVKTRPSGPLELEMYLPYSVVLSSPQAR
jgi:hypothetical protein